LSPSQINAICQGCHSWFNSEVTDDGKLPSISIVGRIFQVSRRIFISAVLLFGTFTFAYGDPSLECSDNSNQVEIGNCVAEALSRVDQSIEIALGIARNSAKELDKVTDRKVAEPALETSQAAWTSFRDQQCEYIGATYGGGSGTGIAIDSCRIELGRSRVDELLNSAQ
ncbi:MAG: lysozyme inhibitor LprI family protein, partial [Pseudomonadota bacterium]